MTRRYRIIYGSSSIEVPIGEFLLGRSTDCHLVLDDPSISRVHASLRFDQGRLFVEDRGSRNGVIVNSKRIEGTAPLEDGDRVKIGHQIIRIAAVEMRGDADRTMGLQKCSSCGAWLAAEDDACTKCGLRREGQREASTTQAMPARQISPNDSVIDYKPLAMMAGLIHKAIQVGNKPDAERLLTNVFDIATRRMESGSRLSEEEFDAIAGAIVASARATESPEHVSTLFRFHRESEHLMSRELVDTLYELVRDVRYRSCPEMSRYLEFLATRERGFNPGERFVLRRLEGLVAICS